MQLADLKQFRAEKHQTYYPLQEFEPSPSVSDKFTRVKELLLAHTL